MRVVTLGTAGHIDHGKTALVRALTGIDTDRLPEEKRRGITIDLGFAHLDLNPLLRLAIVDVPGHEAFVRNMTAGATGIDLGLLVIAADEGFMPQTYEHLAILELLGVAPAAIVLSKADLVERDWLDLVEEDVKERLSTSAYARAPILSVSVKTGAGIAELKETLSAAAHAVPARRRDDVFRLPADRVFTVRGTGTVVTGTVWSGELQIDQTVRLIPSEASARVRGLQRQGEAMDRVSAGERAAIALASLPVHSIDRGETLVSDPAWNAARTLTVLVRQLPDAARPLQSRQRVHLYLGTAAVLARVHPLAGPIAPGQQGWVLLNLEQTTAARTGDRLILRSYSPVTTIAGGEVFEWSDQPYRRREGDIPQLERLRSPELTDRCSAALALAGWHGLLINRLTLQVPGFSRTDPIPGVVAGPACFDPELVRTAETAVLEKLDELHAAQPFRSAIELEQVRSATPRRVPQALREVVIARLIESGRIVERTGGLARAGWEPKLNPKQGQVRAALLELLESAGLTPPDRDQLAVSLGPEVPELLRSLTQEGTLVAIDRAFFMSSRAVQKAEATIRAELTAKPLSVPELKAVLGLSRKHLIPLLEHFDRVGLTRRIGDLRTLTALEKVSDLRDATT